ncbi:MAG: sigma-54 interaction domain-containing protein [Anaerovoracaceae bacterium]
MDEKNCDFNLTLDECKAILNRIGGVVIVDSKGNIRYMSDDMIDKLSKLDEVNFPGEVLGRNINDIHPGSRLMGFLSGSSEEELSVYMGLGTLCVSKMKSLYENNKKSGAVDYDLFSTVDDVKEFIDKLKSFSFNGEFDISDRINFSAAVDKNMRNTKYSIPDIIGKSKAVINLKNTIMRVSESDSTVLIEAETGCGKELVAHSLHNTSRRMNSPFIEMNCAAIPETLFESEIFGYEGGAFTGAQKGGKAGKLEMAERGTLFLDEVDQLPYHMQSKLLRVLQEKEFSRIGGKTKSMDVRIIAASNKELDMLVKQGKFREDLYYRLNVVRISIPPLRERKEDIPLLTDKFIKDMNFKLGKNVEGISSEVMKYFYQYRWPGNVRELMNLIERAMNLCLKSEITMEDLGDFFTYNKNIDLNDSILYEDHPLEKARKLAEQDIIFKAIRACGGNKQKAAEFLKISRATLYNKIADVNNTV